ncbi:MAG: prephenate dehydrogenase/arogenate dehydrogenase family protein [Ignavibacteriales bacterium]|nr:prephenate dehydrogenase/arogenate dehydrogenase family protein [Ignavibacteriales bacterium]
MEIRKISIIGLGLIGGSIAKAIKNFSSTHFISGFDNPDILDKALEQKVIDKKLSSFEESLDADLIFLCLPVDASINVFEKLSEKINPNQILTDVCGVKSIFQEIWDKKERKGIYIGGHPMTGKEKGGFENSDPLLFENCVYILNESAKEFSVIDSFTEIIHQLGAKITFLNPKVHDIIVASVSHLPQLLSVSLINSAGLKGSNINFFDYAAGGFRDMTRIASSEFNVWEPVLRENRKNIIQAIDNFIFDLDQMKKSISNEDYKKLTEKFENARVKRDEIPKSNKGFINQIYDVFVFVKDEPGVISKISTALFENKINIKDIELLKIREGSGGTFRIAFESEVDAEKAKEIIEKIGFSTKI